MKTMLCPVCKSSLVVTGQARLETLCEHVENPNGEASMKNKYECMNNSCPCFHVVFWNSDGELYVEDYDQFRRIEFIDENNAPFNSIERQFNDGAY